MPRLVGNPLFVDVVVVPRQHAHHFPPAHVDADVRADRIHDVDRFGLGHFPGPRVERPGPVCQRPDRTQIDHVGRQFRHHALLEIRRDFHVLAAADRAEFFDAGDFGHEADAARALDAARHHGLDQRPEVLLLDRALVLAIARAAGAERHRLILQVALAALITDRAVQRVVDQQEFHHAFPRLLDHRRARVDHLRRTVAIGRQVVDPDRTTGLRLRHPDDLDQAHPAVAGDRQPFMIAEARDLDAGLLASLQQRDAVLDLDLGAVDDQFFRHAITLRAWADSAASR